MAAKDVILQQLGTSMWLFETFTKDFNDADAKFQPFPGGNHLNWILCHLAGTEDWIVSTLTGKPKVLSDAFHKSYGGSGKCIADDGMTKAEAWKVFTETRTRTVDFLKTFDDKRYDDAAPSTGMEMFKKVGDLVGMLSTHPFWHFGQLTVNRRMLNKPALFGG